MEDMIMAKKKNHHLRKIGNVWYFEKMAGGKRIKMALSESVTEARKLRDQYLLEITVYGEIQSHKASHTRWEARFPGP